MRRFALIGSLTAALLALPSAAAAAPITVDVKVTAYNPTTGVATAIPCGASTPVTAAVPTAPIIGRVYSVTAELGPPIQVLSSTLRPEGTPCATPGQTPGQTPAGGNRPPVCPSSSTLLVPKNGSVRFESNCTDPDGDRITYVANPADLPKHMTYSLDGQAPDQISYVIFTAENGYEGPDQFKYQATDKKGNGLSNVVTVDVQILPRGQLKDETNEIVGSALNDVLAGGAFNDLLSGGKGDDDLDGGRGDDELDGGRGDDNLDGGAGNDEIDAGAGNDEADGGTGNDEIDGGAGADSLDGGAGNDTISDVSSKVAQAAGAAGNDVTGGSGKDTIDVRNGRRDDVSCGTGKDVVVADRNDDVARNCEKVLLPGRGGS